MARAKGPLLPSSTLCSSLYPPQIFRFNFLTALGMCKITEGGDQRLSQVRGRYSRTAATLAQPLLSHSRPAS